MKITLDPKADAVRTVREGPERAGTLVGFRPREELAALLDRASFSFGGASAPSFYHLQIRHKFPSFFCYDD